MAAEVDIEHAPIGALVQKGRVGRLRRKRGRRWGESSCYCFFE